MSQINIPSHTGNLTLNDENFIFAVENSQFVDEEGNSFPVLQVKVCEESDQVKSNKTSIGLTCDVPLLMSRISVTGNQSINSHGT